MKALIVEGDGNVAESISLCLQLKWPDAIATVAAEGVKAVDMVRSESYDLILLDAGLSDISGYEVLRRIRRFSNVPVIIVTIPADSGDKVRWSEMGADDYIAQPFFAGDLIARVNAVVHR